MQNISRRRFIRDASLGAAAVGAVAVVGGPSALGLASTSAAAAPVTSDLLRSRASNPSVASGTDVMAHIVDDSSGTISMYFGTTKVTFQDHALTEALLRAAR